MDPLTAIGLVTNMIAFVDFGIKLFQGAKQIRDSKSGQLNENASHRKIVTETKTLSKGLENLGAGSSEGSAFSGDLNYQPLHELANECQLIADEMLKLLDKIKPKSDSKWESFMSALRNESNSSDKAKLQARLDSCRGQLHMQINFLLQQGISASIEELMKTSKQNVSRFEMIQSSIAKLENDLNLDNVNGANNSLEKFFGIPKDVMAAVAQKRILDGLYFDEMDDRYNHIHDPHDTTLQWAIFRQSDYETSEDDGTTKYSEPTEISKTTQDAREVLLKWLSAEEGVFHISAKLGAGKSTLMKLLSTHSVVQKKLKLWAKTGDRKLICSKFFFWRPGKSRYQKSVAGMRRSLLYGTLKSWPDLTSSLFPSLWNEASETAWQAQKRILLADRDVEKAFKILRLNCIDNGGFRACFFIDGLDELDESLGSDYQDLTQEIFDWVKYSQGNVKFCVSSREYNAFDQMNFPVNHRIQLHELTRHDMEIYVRDRLKGIGNEEDMDCVCTAIVLRAQGIFLWVILVTRQMRKRLQEGCTREELIAEVNGLPDGLGKLFDSVLASMDRKSRTRAYRTLDMVRQADVWNIKFRLKAWMLLEAYDKDPTSRFGMEHLVDSSKFEERFMESAKRQLNSCCEGLVELSRDDLTFAHRSVADLLEFKRSMNMLAPFLKGFNTPEALLQVTLCQWRVHQEHGLFNFPEALFKVLMYDREIVEDQRLWDGLWNKPQDYELFSIFRAFRMHNPDTNPWEFLESVEQWAANEMSRNEQHYEGMLQAIIIVGAGQFIRPSTGRRFRLGSRPFPSSRAVASQFIIVSPEFILANTRLQEGSICELQEESLADEDSSLVPLLVGQALAYLLRGNLNLPTKTDGDLLSWLIERDLVSPVIDVGKIIASLRSVHKSRRLWCPTLLEVVFLCLILVRHNRRNMTELQPFLAKLLVHKADLNFSISLMPDNRTLNLRRGDTVGDGHEVSVTSFLTLRITKPFRNLGPREIIEEWGTEDTQNLLGLIDNQFASAAEKRKEGHNSELSKLDEALRMRTTWSPILTRGGWGWWVLLGFIGAVLAKFLYSVQSQVI